MDELKAHIAKQDKAINALSIKLGRPNGGLELDDTRTQAIALLEIKHLLRSPKREIGTGPLFRPSEDEIAEATHAINGAKNLFRVVDQASLTYDEKKSLTSSELLSDLLKLSPCTSFQDNGRPSGPSAPPAAREDRQTDGLQRALRGLRQSRSLGGCIGRSRSVDAWQGQHRLPQHYLQRRHQRHRRRNARLTAAFKFVIPQPRRRSASSLGKTPSCSNGLSRSSITRTARTSAIKIRSRRPFLQIKQELDDPQ